MHISQNGVTKTKDFVIWKRKNNLLLLTLKHNTEPSFRNESYDSAFQIFRFGGVFYYHFSHFKAQFWSIYPIFIHYLSWLWFTLRMRAGKGEMEDGTIFLIPYCRCIQNTKYHWQLSLYIHHQYLKLRLEHDHKMTVWQDASTETEILFRQSCDVKWSPAAPVCQNTAIV